MTEKNGMTAAELVHTLRKARATIIIAKDPIMQHIAATSEGLLYLCHADDNGAAESLEPDGIARIAAARKKHAIRNSIGYDLKSKSEASLTDVAIDVLAGKMDSFGIVRKHPDRAEQLEIVGVLIASILDVRAATNPDLIEQHAKISRDGIVESGPCVCGWCGNYKVVESRLEPDRLWVKYQCPPCKRLGERSWLE